MQVPDDLDLAAELDAAEDIVMGTVPPEVQALRDHIDRDHGIMVQLGRIADHALSMLEHVNMDTDEDRALYARAVGALRDRLGEIAATMKETDAMARDTPAGCPESKMDDGSHATDYEDSGSCPWCGERNPDWREAENDSAPAGAVKEEGGP